MIAYQQYGGDYLKKRQGFKLPLLVSKVEDSGSAGKLGNQLVRAILKAQQ